MRVLHLSSYDAVGGAAICAYRLHTALKSAGVQSGMLVQDKIHDDLSVIGPASRPAKLVAKVRPHIDLFPLHLYKHRVDSQWGLNWLPNRIASAIARWQPDLVHLHWVGNGFLPIKEVARIRRPIVWTLHDSWVFTGGCHSPYECLKYQSQCGNCPQLNSNSSADLSHWIWQRKSEYWEHANLTIVAPSKWMAQNAGRSSLLANRSVRVVSNGIDTSVFKPADKKWARNMLNLPQQKKIILFGALGAITDKKKGFHHLREAILMLNASNRLAGVELVIFGSSEPTDPPSLGLPARYLGRLHDDVALALLYSAADVMCVPSLQESFGMTAAEAMACGTPVVAFATSGLLDIVDHQENGYLAEPQKSEDLARGIEFVLSDESRRKALSQDARRKISAEFEIGLIARNHTALYEELVTSPARSS